MIVGIEVPDEISVVGLQRGKQGHIKRLSDMRGVSRQVDELDALNPRLIHEIRVNVGGSAVYNKDSPVHRMLRLGFGNEDLTKLAYGNLSIYPAVLTAIVLPVLNLVGKPLSLKAFPLEYNDWTQAATRRRDGLPNSNPVS